MNLNQVQQPGLPEFVADAQQWYGVRAGEEAGAGERLQGEQNCVALQHCSNCVTRSRGRDAGSASAAAVTTAGCTSVQ